MSDKEAQQVQEPAGEADKGMCASPACTTISNKRCAACKVLYYCSPECQRAHWPKHKAECRQFREMPDAPDVTDEEQVVKAHHREFRRIVHKHGLDKGDRADLLADFLTDQSENKHISTDQLAEKFGIPRADASTLLAWVNVALRFKETNLDKAQEK